MKIADWGNDGQNFDIDEFEAMETVLNTIYVKNNSTRYYKLQKNRKQIHFFTMHHCLSPHKTLLLYFTFLPLSMAICITPL